MKFDWWHSACGTTFKDWTSDDKYWTDRIWVPAAWCNRQILFLVYLLSARAAVSVVSAYLYRVQQHAHFLCDGNRALNSCGKIRAHHAWMRLNCVDAIHDGHAKSMKCAVNSIESSACRVPLKWFDFDVSSLLAAVHANRVGTPRRCNNNLCTHGARTRCGTVRARRWPRQVCKRNITIRFQERSQFSIGCSNNENKIKSLSHTHTREI